MKHPYDDEKDEVLIERLREGETAVTDYIMDKYKSLVRGKAQTMYLLGADREDLIQEGMIGLFKAVRDYDAGRDASFHTFADLCVSRQMYSAIEAAGRQKNIPLNTYVSLYERIESDHETQSKTLADTLTNDGERPVEDEIIAREEAADIRRIIERELSDFERRALELWMVGMTSTEVAKVLGKEAKATDNALTRAKKKLRQPLRSRD